MFQTFYEEGLIINILAIVNLLQNCYVYKNFHLRFTFIYPGCNDIMINKEAAIISSPGYRLGSSLTYPPNLQCSWLINNPADKELAIVFDDNFDTEVDFDILTVSINFHSVNLLTSSMQHLP